MNLPLVRELLARYPSGLQPLSEITALGGAGGYSGAQFWRFRAARGELVLRSWPPGWPPRSQLERIHHWLSLTADIGFTPVPLLDNSGQSVQEVQDRLWELTPWLRGVADSARPPLFCTSRPRSADWLRCTGGSHPNQAWVSHAASVTGATQWRN